MKNILASDMAVKWHQHTEFCKEEWQNTFADALLIKKVASYGDHGH